MYYVQLGHHLGLGTYPFVISSLIFLVLYHSRRRGFGICGIFIGLDGRTALGHRRIRMDQGNFGHVNHPKKKSTRRGFFCTTWAKQNGNSKMLAHAARSGIAIRDGHYGGKDEADATGGSSFSGVNQRMYMIVFFFVFLVSFIRSVYTLLKKRSILPSASAPPRHSSPISGNKRRNISSTISTTRCLLMNGSANKSNESSTSSCIVVTSSVAKYLERTYGGTTSTMTRAHSRLMAMASSWEGGTRAGPSASSGKMARRMACKAGGSRAGFKTRA